MLTHSERGVNTQVCEQWFEKGVNTCEQCFEKVLTQSVETVCERSPEHSEYAASIGIAVMCAVRVAGRSRNVLLQGCTCVFCTLAFWAKVVKI